VEVVVGIRGRRQDRARKQALATVAEARDRSGATLTKVRETAAPKVEQAVDWAAPRVEHAKDWAGPKVEQAVDWAAPRVATAVERLREDVVPRVAEAVAAAVEASEPVREEAAVRGKAALAALKGEVAAPPKKKRHLGRKAVGVMAVLGAGAAAWKAWQAKQEQAQPWQDPLLAGGTSSVPSMATGATGSAATSGDQGRPLGTVADAVPGDASDDAAGASPDEALADAAAGAQEAPAEVSPETVGEPVDSDNAGGSHRKG
jgi:hypothetical protein